jgi:hypothetical protein
MEKKEYDAEGTTEDTSSTVDKRASLEKKMASWEATEEERKAATLGGLEPGKVWLCAIHAILLLICLI